MRKIAVIGLLAGLVFCARCVRTMAPVVEDKDLIADASLAGEWVNRDDTRQILRIEAPDAEKHYRIEFIDEKGKSGRFIGRLGRLGELMVAEINPEDLPDEWSDEYKGHFASLFSFYIVTSTKPTLKVSAFETDWLEEYLKAHPGELAVSPGDNSLVTSSPNIVRTFVLKHWKDKGALSEAVLVRRKDVKKPD